MGFVSILRDKPEGMWNLCKTWGGGKALNLFMQATTGLVTLTVNAVMKGMLNGF